MRQSVSASGSSQDATSIADGGAARRRTCALACAMLAVMLWGCTAAAAPAKSRDASAAGYFVDFRSRPGYLFGHTYIVYGRLDAHGKPYNTRFEGIYPIDGQAGLIMGSVIPVRASVRGVHDDFKERPTNVYRRRLSAAQYARLVYVVRHLRARDRAWNLWFKNCNDFAIEVAKGLDMTTPPSWLLPSAFVAGLRLLNGP
jgi:hypothetical protein